METGPGSLILGIMMIAAFALTAGGLWLAARRRELKKGALMLVAALVLFGNVLIWTV